MIINKKSMGFLVISITLIVIITIIFLLCLPKGYSEHVNYSINIIPQNNTSNENNYTVYLPFPIGSNNKAYFLDKTRFNCKIYLKEIMIINKTETGTNITPPYACLKIITDETINISLSYNQDDLKIAGSLLDTIENAGSFRIYYNGTYERIIIQYHTQHITTYGTDGYKETLNANVIASKQGWNDLMGQYEYIHWTA